MNDFDLVIGLQHGRLPIRAANHQLVQFYRHLFRLQTQTLDEFWKRDIFLHLSRFAIYVYAQEISASFGGLIQILTSVFLI